MLTHLAFDWKGPGLLRDEVCRPIHGVSAVFAHPAWRGPSSITLWRMDGSGLKVTSQMHDVAPMTEVGVLNFEVVTGSHAGVKITGLRDRFNRDLKAHRLCVTESGVVAESGIVLVGDEEMVIVAGTFPFTLAVKGAEFDPSAWDPEYPLSEYAQDDL